MGNSDLKAFVDSHQNLFVLTGAGCSTNSGIPDYRDADGSWKRTQQHVSTLQLTADYHLSGGINAVHLKNRLRDVQSDCRDHLHG
jgi:NAD-dependent SIR2 family protein deacetylase